MIALFRTHGKQFLRFSTLDLTLKNIFVFLTLQDDLHRDFEIVQSMLEERQSEVERLQQELLVVPVQLQADFDNSIRSLQSKCEVVEERDEDLYVLNEEKVSAAAALSNCALIAAVINSLFSPLLYALVGK